jgi:phosphopantothenoylcysteine decarboxylase/phosphopantothenate--cysteine ligase
VADYRPATVLDRKMKKRAEEVEIRMERTPDIAWEIGKRKGDRFLVGFAAETDDLEENAREKLRRKGMDLIVANDVTAEGAGFEVDTNIATVYDRNGPVAKWPKMSKEKMAERLIALIGERLNDR